MSVSANYPTIRPTLLLDFSNTEQLDPRITFSRPTTATYYDGKTTAVAEQNLLTYSQDFSNAAWSKLYSSTITANSTTAPDGTSTASTYTAGASQSSGAAIRPLSAVYVSSANNMLFSLYVKYTNTQFISIASYSAVSNYFVATFDIVNGAVTKTGSAGNHTYVSSTIASVGSGWYRITLCGLTTAGSEYPYLCLNTTGTPTYNNFGVEAFTPAGTETVYIWGAQLEQRSTVTAYTPTTTAPITNYIPVLLTAPSNEARFDHNPTTRESLGLLIEEQRTNLLTYSDDFSNAAWTKNIATVTADTIAAPDGSLSADTLTASGAYGNIGQYGSTTSTSVTSSAFAKAGSFAKIELLVTNTIAGFTNGAGALFDLSTGAYVSQRTFGTGYSVSSYSIQAVGNGWYRVSASFAVPSASTQGFAVGLGSTAVSGSSIYIWGAQLEAGSFATSYIPTVASQVTRSADSASMTGSNFSSWYSQQQGALYSEFIVASTIPSMALVSADNGASNGLSLYKSLSSPNLYAYEGSANALLGTVSSNVSAKAVTSFDSSSVAGSLNGAAVVSSSAGYPSSPTQLNIGRSFTSIHLMTGTIKRIAYYPARLSNTNLQAITS